jgi:hypothetical protein
MCRRVITNMWSCMTVHSYCKETTVSGKYLVPHCARQPGNSYTHTNIVYICEQYNSNARVDDALSEKRNFYTEQKPCINCGPRVILFAFCYTNCERLPNWSVVHTCLRSCDVHKCNNPRLTTREWFLWRGHPVVCHLKPNPRTPSVIMHGYLCGWWERLN